jgi:large repetitive protein
VVTVTVNAPAIVANNDAAGPVNGASGANGVVNVFTNDLLNGSPVNPADVTLTEPTPDPTDALTLNPDGSVDVAPGTPAGSYTLTYQICENLNPTNCDDAVVTVNVVPAPIVANNDNGGPVDGITGATNVLNVLTNDLLNGNPATLSEVILTLVIANPALTLNPDGSVDVAPGTPSGNYTLTYSICEILNIGNCDQATATISVDLPLIVAEDDVAGPVNGLVGATAVLNVFDNDELNGLPVNPADVTLTETVADPTGALTLNADGTVDVAPNTPAGPYTLTYQICENLNPTNCDPAVVTVNVVAAPIVANNDAGSANGFTGGTAVADVWENDLLNGSPVNPSTITTTVVTPASNPGVVLNTTNGQVTVAPGTPAAVYTITYQICENLNPTNCDDAVVTVTVNAPAIVANNDAGSANGFTGGTAVADVWANDLLNGSPVNPSAITTTVVTPASNPGVVLNTTNGQVTVAPGTPAAVYTITYQICENLNPTNCDDAVVTVTVNAPAIVANDDAGSANGFTGGTAVANVWANDLLNGSAVNPSAITTTVVTPASNPGVVLNTANGQVTVAPGTPAAVYTITYQICENLNPTNCDDAVVTVTVNAPAIVANNDAGSVNGLTGGTAVANVWTNDLLNGSAVNPSAITTTVVTPASIPGVVLNTATGQVTVAPGTPAAVYTITYQICENLNPTNCDDAVVTVTVTPAPIVANNDNGGPVNGQDGATDLLNVFTNDLLNGSPVNPADVTLTEPIPDPTGALTLNPDGSVDVAPGTPAGSYNLTYQICENLNPTNCDQAVVTVSVDLSLIVANDDNVGPVNPITDGTAVVNVFDNDELNSAPFNPADVILTEPTPDPTGSLTLNPDGTVDVDPSTPSGTYTLTYQICEAINPTNCDQAVVTVVVPNNPPVAVNDFNVTLVNVPVGGNVLTNDFDIDGDDLTLNLTPITPPANGAVVLSADGSYTYTPNVDFVGTDSFVYEICDDGTPSLCDQATVTIRLTDPTSGNDPPIANDDVFVTQTGVPVGGNILDNDSDPDGDGIILTTTPITPPTNGTVVINSNGNIVYTPNPGFEGTDTFIYEICDDGTPVLCDQATVTVTVIPDVNGPQNDPPFAGDDFVLTNINTPVSGNHLPNDSDPNGDDIIINTTPITPPANGSVTINPDGSFTYTPDADYVGPDQWVYQICDDGTPSLCAQATGYVLVVPRDITATANDVCINDVPYMDYSVTSTNFAVSAPVTIEWYDMGDNLIATYTGQPLSGQVLWPGAVIDGFGNGLDWPGWIYADGAWSQGSDGFETLIPQAKVVFSVNPTDTVIVNYPPQAPFCIPRPPEGPVAVDDINNTLVNIPVGGNVLTNDYSPSGANLTANTTPLTLPVNGSVTLNANGTYTYTPALDFVGIDSFEYIVCDDNVPSLCDTALVTITVIDPTLNNDPPVANPDFYVTYEDVPVSGNVLNNDSDPDGDNIIINTTPISGPSNGSVTINASGVINYTPNTGYTGVDSFVYEICDDGTPSLCAQAMVTILVLPDIDDPNNNPPFAGDDFALTPKNEPVGGNLLDNDYDPDGDDIIISTTPVSPPANGTVVINTDGTFTYTPDADYVGPDNFVYSICDDGTPSLCAQATAYITVVPANNPPVAVDDINNTLINVPVGGNVLTNDYDPDGDDLTVTSTITPPSNGSVTLNPDGSYVYTPDTDFIGTDTFVYEMCDNGDPQRCDQALVTITVITITAGNDPPVANPDFYVTYVDVPVSGNVLNNDSDPDGDDIVIGTTPITPPSNGSVTINPSGVIDYVPNAGFVGTDVFTYGICDDGVPSLCAQTTVTIVVLEEPRPGNNPPFAGDDFALTPQNTPVGGNVLLNDYDPDGDNIILNTVPTTPPSNGTVVMQPNGDYVYTPDSDYLGPDQFVYQICDDGTPSLCAFATVYITVHPANTPPVAVDDINHTLINTPVPGNVLTNDYDPDGDDLTVTTTPVTPPSNGTLVLDPDGSYTYTPNTGFTGTDTFVYEVCDNGNPQLCDQATVTITVTETTLGNDPPVANPDYYVTYVDIPVGGNVLNNDSDPDGDGLIIGTTPITPPSNGSVTINPDGTILYTPNGGFTGTDTFVYEVCDDVTPSLCDQATVTILVLGSPDPDNNPPFAGDDFAFTPKNEPVSGNLLLNDYDPDGDNIILNVTPISGPSNGSVAISPDGTFTYTPNNDYVGPDQFVYQICDDGVPSLCAQATAYITVYPFNNPPVAVDDINNTLVNTPVSGNVVTNDFDPDGDDLTVTSTPVTPPSNGTLVLNPDGSYTYTPNTGFTGADTFVYEVCDNGDPQLCDQATVTITVVQLTTDNDPPVANPDFYVTYVGVPVTANITDNDADPDGDDIILNTTPISGPSNGTVVLNASGVMTYTPNAGFVGTDVYTYEICDDGVPSLCDQTTVTIVVLEDTDSDNDPPFAGDDVAYTPVNIPVSGNHLVNDYDPNGDNIIINTTPISGPSNGTVVINSSGTFTYTPNTDYIGPDQFVYEICDDGVPSLCAQATAYILVYPGPSLTWVVTQPLCHGQSTGAIDLTVLNATPPLSYIWSNGATTQDLNNIPAGTYGVIVEDALGSVVQASIVVSQPAVLTVSVDVSDETVVNGCNGTATANPLGGTAPFTYLWNDPAAQTTQTATGLCAGIIQVTVTDANGCPVTTSNVINPPSCDLDVVVSGTPVSCNGGTNGTVNATPITVQNNLPFTYLWSNGATTQTQSGIPAGPYTVTVTDGIGCQASGGFVVTQPLALSLTSSTVDEQTFGGCDGSATVNPTGGTAPYTYAWTGGQTTQTATGLCPATYTVTVTDANGCTAQRTVTINALTCTGFAVAVNTTSLTCSEAGNGAATAVVTNGTAPFSYLWSTGATTQAISGIAAGNYSVTVTDALNCEQSVDGVVTQPDLLQAATAVDNVTCFGFANGTIDLTVTGGTTPYSFAWSNGSTSEDLTGLGPNTYNVTVTDANGCTVNRSATVTEPAILAASSVNTNVTCFGGSDGAIDLTVTGGLAPYQYSWAHGPVTQDVSGLTANTYSVTIVDQNGCVLPFSTSITQSDNFVPTITAGGPTTFCQGGSVVLTATEGASYLWSTGATTQSITVSTTGNYSVTVTTAQGCSGTSSATPVLVNPNPTPTASAIGATTFCQGGSVQLTTGSFSSYAWSNGATTQSITVSTGGSYSVTVTNANGCVGTSNSVNVTVNPLPTPTVTPQGPTTFCQGGSVTLTSTAAASYLWSTGATTQSITVSTAGSYSVTVTNANGCVGTSASVPVTINSLPTPTVNVSGPTTFCQGGSVTLTASPAASYLWSNNATTQAITVSTAGSYSVTVTDANGCQATSSPVNVTVNPTPAPTITAGGPTTFCQGGSVTLTSSPSASYLWSTGATTQSITVSTSGSYTVTVTNANGCTGTSAPVSVTVNTPPTSTITPIGPTTFCEGGSVQLIASGGASYEWSNGATTQAITVSVGGTYTVRVFDANGCSTLSAPVTITVNPRPTVAIDADGPTNICAGGSVTLTATSATAVSYLWNTGATSQSISVSTAGSYTVTVTDANGCTRTSTPRGVTVTPNPSPTVTASGPTTFCPGGSVTLTASLATSYLWSTGATTQAITVSTAGIYTVTATDDNGCQGTSAPVNVTINSNPAPTVTAGGPTTLCQGQSVTLTASAGASYLWSTGATTQSITVSSAGNYTVTVTDANGCSGTSAPVTVTVNPLPTPTVTAGGPTTFCQGGSVTLTASAAVSYLWSTGAVGQSITVSTSGNYTVQVTDANGCVATSAPVVVNVNPLPTPTVTADGPTTFCQGGSVTLTSSAAASYLWSTGATTQSITVSTAGNYQVTVTDVNGCGNASAFTTVSVRPNPTPGITASGPTTFCQGGSVTLTASAGASYLWSTGATTQSITVSASGSYSVTVTDVNGCSGTSVPTAVTVSPLPTPTVLADGPTTFCAGGSVTLVSTGAAFYSWSTGAITQSITVSATGNYSVTVTDANGCTATSAPVSVNANPNPTPTVSTGGPTTFCAGGSVTLTSSFAQSYLWSNGATTQAITVSATGNYSVTVTDGNGCVGTSIPVAVNINGNPTPEVEVDGPTALCQGQSVELTASAGTAYLWSTGATTQSITVSAAGSYTVSVTDINGCTGASDPVAITVNPLPEPTITAGGPTTFCVGQDVTLTASAASSYLWSTGATTQSITVSATGIYNVTVTDANGCSGAATPVAVTVNPPVTPTISAGGPTTFCDGGGVMLTSTPAVSYLWSTGATTQSITVSVSGSYSVTTVDNNGCEATSAPVPVTTDSNPVPTVSADGPTTFCAGGSVTLSASASVSYLWSTGATSQSITVSAAGSYSVTVTDVNGCEGVSAPVNVTVNPLPTPTISADGPTTFCVGQNVTLTASAGSSYQWSTGAVTQSITVSTTGIYNVTVTDANGCSGAATPVTVTVNPLPIPLVTVSGPTTFCEGGSVVLTSRPANSYLWSTGETTQSITVDASGSYTVTVSNANGCQATSAPVNVTVHPIPTPTVNAAGPLEFCQGGSVVLGIIAPGTVVWSNGDVSALTTVNASGDYWATYTDANGCTGNSDTVTVIVNPLPTPLIETVGTPSFCAGETIDLSTGVYSSYLWSNGATTQGISISDPGTYTFTVTVTDGNGCAGTSPPVVVEINATPTPTISPDGVLEICDGESITLTSAPAQTYLWSNGETTQSITVTTAGVYNVFATDASSCSAISSDVTVIVHPNPTPTVVADGPLEFCTGGSVNLSTQPYASYVWSTGSVAPSISVSNSGSYSVTVTDANGCVGVSPAADVTRYPVPTVTVGTSGPTDICAGGSVELTATAASAYLWSTGATTQSITVSAQGSYTVTITDANGCQATSAPVSVTLNDLPTPTVFPFGPQEICEGSTVTLTSTTAASYQWSTGETTQSITVSTGGIYTLNVQDLNGCTSANVDIPVTVNPLPTPVIVANGPTEFCDGGNVLLSTSQPYVSYVWSTGTVNANVLASNSGTFTVTVTDGNGCVGTSAPLTVTEYPAPPVSVSTSGPTNVCDGGTVELTASVASSYLWSTGETTQSITVSTAGAYTVTITDVNGCAATSAPVNVTLLDLPTPTVFPFGPQEICDGSSVTLTSTTAASYQWSTGETTQSITVSTGGLYTLHVQDLNGCTSASVDIPVTVNPLPTPVIVANGPTEFCDGGSVLLSTSQPYVSYVWSTGTVNANVLASNSGTFTVTVTDANGCVGTSAPLTVTEYPAPVVAITADGPTDICVGGSVELTASAADSYLWSTGATTQSITVSQNGSYTVTVTDANGCVSTATPVNVTLLNLPTPTVFPFGPQEICEGGSVTLTSTTASSYLWSTGETTQSIDVTTGGVYTLTVQDLNGCTSASVDIPVTVNPLPEPVIQANGPTEFCAGSSVTLSTTQPFNGYVWSTGTVSPSINVNSSGTFTVTVTDAKGCQGTSDAVTVTRYDNPPVTVTTSGSPNLCEGGSVELTANAADSYLWSNGETTQTITVDVAGSYTVTITDANGCQSTSSAVNVTILTPPAPTLFPFGPQFICEGQAITLTSTTASSYLWSTGATTQSIVVTDAGDYSVTVTDANGCEGVTGIVPVTVNPLPEPTVVANGAIEFCQGGNVQLTTQNFAGYQWSSGAAQQSTIVTQPGDYFVTVIDNNGCVGVSDPLTITVNPPPNITINADGPTEFCDGGSVTLTATAGQSYSWSNGQVGQSITVFTSGTYIVSVTDANGCVGQSVPVTISVYPLPNPNITASGPTEFCSSDSVQLTSSPAANYLWNNGATTQSIWVSTAGNYFVTLSNGFGCEATSSSINVTVNNGPSPFIMAGGPTEFCNGGSVVLTASGAQSYLWSTGAVTPMITVSSSGTFTVTGFDANGCSGVSVPIEVTEFDVPEVNITADGPTVLCQGDQVTLTASVADSYLWSTGATTQSITVSTAGTYTVNVVDANGCPGASAGVTVFVNPLPTPVIAADGPLAFCEGDDVTLSASGYQQYLWSTGATTPSITVSEAGQFSVTVVDENGCAGTSALVTTVINPDPVVTITTNDGDLEICQGTSTVLTASQGSSYQWSTGSVSQSITVNQAGTYTVTVTNQFGCTGTASVDIIVRPLPDPSPEIIADGETTFCAGGSVTLGLTAEYEGYQWSTGATTQGITVSTSGLYTVTVTNEFGCTGAASGVVVTVNPNPNPIILSTGDTEFCDGGSVVLATSSVYAAYQWSTGAATQFITVTESGDYDVTVTNSFGCTATSAVTTVNVFELPEVEVTADGPTTFCPGSSVTLTASGTGPFLWSNGATTASIEVFLPGNYTVTVTEEVTGCSNTSAPVTVEVYEPFLAEIVADGPTSFCGDGQVTLTASAGEAYLWSTGATTQSITVSETGVYGVLVTDANGCQGPAAQTVTVLPEPIPVIVPEGNPPYCEGESVTLTAALDIGGSYQWSTGATTQSIEVTESGLYSVVITNVLGCSAEAFLPIGFVPSPTVNVTVEGDGTVCEGETIQLSASFSIGGSYVWSNGATGQNISVGEAGEYTVTVTNLAGCSATSDPVTVTVLPGTRPDAGNDIVICAGESATLTATGADSYEWSTGQTGASITVSPTETTVYVVTSTAEGCGFGLSSEVTVTVAPQPTAAFEHTEANLGTTITFTDLSEPQASITTWEWDFGDGQVSLAQNPQYTYNDEEGTYTVTLTVTTANGCADTVSMELEIEEFFTITDVLTPNNDGVNDYIWITSSSAQVINATFYSRWGESVWTGVGKDLRFNGRSNAGAELPAGTYYYVIQVDYGDGDVRDHTGYVTLIR